MSDKEKLINEVNRRIFTVCAEFSNQGIHNRSYYLRQTDDLLLECCREVYKPVKRKKLDERLTDQFEEFVTGCVFE